MHNVTHFRRGISPRHFFCSGEQTMGIQEMIDQVIGVSSKAERRKMREGDTHVAMWLINRVLYVTESQAESLSFRICEQIQTGDA